MPPAKPHGVPLRDSFAALVSAIPPAPQTEPIATGDSQAPTYVLNSFWSILPGEFQQSSLRLAHILEGERTRFNEVRHDGSAPASEQAQEFIDKSALCSFARHRSLENECCRDLFGPPQCFLPFQAVDRRLHGGVCGPLFGWKRFLDLSDRTGSSGS